MATSLPATNLNNDRWARAKAEQFGAHVLRINILIYLCAGMILALAGVGYLVHRNTQAIENFRPLVVRINDVGKAEAVYLRDFQYHPQTAEVQRDLADFVTCYYTRMKSRMNDYFHSKYYLSRTLGMQSYAYDQKTKWTKDLFAGKLAENAIDVRKVVIQNLSTLPYSATVDFSKIYYAADGFTETRREDHTAAIQFEFAPKVEGEMIRYNPLGLQITDLRDTEAFH